MVERAGAGLRFDNGIEPIIHQNGSGDARLPELASINPPREQLKTEADQVLPPPLLARVLDGFLAPRVTSPELLLPDGFAAMFDEMRQAFSDRRGRNVPDLEEARKLLGDEQVNRDLLAKYRNSLLGA